MIRNVSRLIAAGFVIAAFAPFASATQVVQRTPQQLAHDAELIVDGKVTSVRSYWNENRSKILTEAVVAVGSTHKGSAGAATVRVVQLGGVVGNVKMTAHGALTWKRGEEVLLFLERSLPGAYQVAGFSQGKYVVERDARTGKGYVRHAMPDGAKGQTPDRAPGATDAQRLTLEQFLSRTLPKE